MNRMQFVKEWADYVKSNPDDWREQHREFIDAQINNAHAFYYRLSKTKNGIEKIMKATGASRRIVENFLKNCEKDSNT